MSTISTPFLLLLLLLLYSTSIATATTITLPLSQLHTNSPQDIYHVLHRLASASLSRAHKTSTSTTTTPLHPHSYGGYAITLSFGTPPQPIPFLMDTGSDFVWFPCTHHYICNNCSSTSPSFHSFIPKLSSTSSILGCLNPKCGWAHHNPDPNSRCPNCPPNNCTQICPPYLLLYGSGITGGLALLETLHLNPNPVPQFLVGCSLFSSRIPAGIAGLAGFGRGPSSLPSQLGLTKFSFCLLSHRFDDTNKTTPLDLTVAGAGNKTAGVSYTPFLKNPTVLAKARFSVYYYLMLRRITVGGKDVKIPYHYLAPADSVTGSGGTIVDSGTSFTYMTRGVYGPLAKEFERQVAVEGYKRNRRMEELTLVGPCFDLKGEETMSFPSVTFHFKGGADMELGLENYMARVEDAVCFTIVTDGVGAEGEGGAGPAVILGNFQMQNFYVEYDLKNERLGFRKQKCG